jgi:hypothetical protein
MDPAERAMNGVPPPLPTAPRLTLPNLERAERIGEFWSYPKNRTPRGAAYRLQGGSDAAGSASGDAARGRPLETLVRDYRWLGVVPLCVWFQLPSGCCAAWSLRIQSC